MKCGYRNCNNEIDSSYNKKFCCKICRASEGVYKSREKLKYKHEERKEVKEYVGSSNVNSLCERNSLQ